MDFKFRSEKELFATREALEKRKQYLKLTNPNANISTKSLSNNTYELEYWVDENNPLPKGYTVRDLAKKFNDFVGFNVSFRNALNNTITNEKVTTDMLVMECDIDFLTKGIYIQVLAY